MAVWGLKSDGRGRSSLDFTTAVMLSCVADRGSVSGKELREFLDKNGYAGTQDSSHLVLLRNLTLRGWVSPVARDGKREFRLTKDGFEALVASLDAAEHLVKKFGGLRNNPPASFSRKKAQVRRQLRQANGVEQKQILAYCRPAFRRLCEFAFAVEIPVAELIDLRIEQVGGDARLGAMADEARAVLAEAIGGRKTGLVFVTARGLPWQTCIVSRCFRLARNAAAIPSEVLLFGNGGYFERQKHTQNAESQLPPA